MRQSRRRFLTWAAGGLVVFLVFGNKGFRQWVSAYREKHRLVKNLTELRSDNARLSKEVSWIKQDPSYSEYLIRKNLGYVKKGEVEYRVIEGKDGSKKK